MAHQSVKVGHDHCGVCGACFLFVAQLHRCPSRVEQDILDVFTEETSKEYGKPNREGLKQRMSEDDSEVEVFMRGDKSFNRRHQALGR
jgi:hypothetical protein